MVLIQCAEAQGFYRLNSIMNLHGALHVALLNQIGLMTPCRSGP